MNVAIVQQPQALAFNQITIQPMQVQIQHTFQPYSTVDIFQSNMNALDNVIRSNNPSVSPMPSPMTPEGHIIKQLVLDETISHTGQSTIFSHLTRLLKAHHEKISSTNGRQKVIIEVDISQLAAELNALNSRLTRALMDIIKDYSISNPSVVKVMGRKHNIPYDGHYDANNKAATFDLKNFPDTLIIVLVEFVRQHRNNNTPK